MKDSKQMTEQELDDISGGPHIRNWWGVNRQEVTDPIFVLHQVNETQVLIVVNPDSM